MERKEDRVRMEKNKRPEITAMLSLSIQRHICPNNDPRIYWAKEVTFDYATTNAVRVDFMKFKPVNNTVSGIEKGDFYCYEVKSSVEDFHSKNGHNFLGDYNYYVMPEEVYEQCLQIWRCSRCCGTHRQMYNGAAPLSAHQRLAFVEVNAPELCYYAGTGGGQTTPEEGGVAFRIYRHEEDWTSTYNVRLRKYDHETGKA